MTAFGDIESNTKQINRIAYEAQVRWETATRLGAALATAAASLLRAEANENGEYPDVGSDPEPSRLALIEAMEVYRKAESEDFWVPGQLSYDKAIEWESSLRQEAVDG